jgi:hypothetical protein
MCKHHIFSSILKHHPLVELAVQLNPDIIDRLTKWRVGFHIVLNQFNFFLFINFPNHIQFFSNCLS